MGGGWGPGGLGNTSATSHVASSLKAPLLPNLHAYKEQLLSLWPPIDVMGGESQEPRRCTQTPRCRLPPSCPPLPVGPLFFVSRLSNIHSVPSVHLDSFVWPPLATGGGLGKAFPTNRVEKMMRNIFKGSQQALTSHGSLKFELKTN